MDGRPLVDAQFVWNKIKNGQGVQNVSSYFNYAYSINTDFLKSVGGYDESYYDYGYEDSDLFCRLMSAKYPMQSDYDCTAIHLFHESPNTSKLSEMHKVFVSNSCDNVVRNINGWGNGI
jgi:predicted glycosyltransferase involved in capsule biosynthesis